MLCEMKHNIALHFSSFCIVFLYLQAQNFYKQILNYTSTNVIVGYENSFSFPAFSTSIVEDITLNLKFEKMGPYLGSVPLPSH